MVTKTLAPWQRLRTAACRLLRARAGAEAASLLETLPFTLHDVHNGFGDDFTVLYWNAPMERYVEAAEWAEDGRKKAAFASVAETVIEVSSSYVRFVVVDLNSDEGPQKVATPNLTITSDVVERALKDAEILLATTGATSGVDRVHTALHGYLKAAGDKFGLQYPQDATILDLVKVLGKGHPTLAATPGFTDKILRAFGVITDTLNPLRNNQSMAHPNASLLAEPEAMLVINTVRTLLHYFDSKLRI